MAKQQNKRAAGEKIKEEKGISAGAAAVIAALITAVVGPTIVLGVQYYLQRQSREPIVGVQNPQRVTDLDLLKKLGVVSAEGSNCTDIGKLQLCWGNGVFNPRGLADTPTCDFELEFTKPFAIPPSVTTAIQGRTSGFAYAIYAETVDEKHITGAGLEVLRRPSREPVVVSYFAIGVPKNIPTTQ